MLKKSTLLSVSIFFLLFIGLSDSGYACHGGGGPHPDCDNKGKGEGKTHNPAVVEIDVQWGGIPPAGPVGYITEPMSRGCVAAQLAQNGVYGSYVCSVGTPLITYSLGVGVPTPRTREPDLCSTVFVGARTLEPNLRYQYGWNDNCEEDDECTIQIDTWFSGDVATGATEGLSDLIKFRAFAQANAAEQGVSFDDTNPFIHTLILEVDEIIISFSATGSNRNIATCHYSNVSNVIFQSDPRTND